LRSRVDAREKAGVIVRQPDEETGQRIKFASAHDLRRSLSQRLINAGVSAETLMIIMRHKTFATTKKFYAAGGPLSRQQPRSINNSVLMSI